MTGVTFQLSEAALEQIAERAAAIVIEQQQNVSPWMTTKEAAAYLRWPVSRIEKLSAANAIPRRKHEGRLLFRREELDEWLERFRG